MTEIAALDHKIETLRTDVNTQLTGLRSDVKELTKALRDLIRMDGEIKNLSTLISRIAGEVDDHESRLRKLEQNSTINTVKLGTGERLFWFLLSISSSILTAVVVFEVTHP